jgi:L-ascorbate metabolism protein UlaG (beta-lactamase superfamily)
MGIMNDDIKVFTQSSIRITNNDLVIYVDPYGIDNDYNDADFVLITHSHYDHFSLKDIAKVRKGSTKFIIPKDLDGKLDNYIILLPGEEYDDEYIKIKTIPAYNIDKPYHKREYGWLGYIVEINNTTYYFAGDTDCTKEAISVKCDVAFVPIGGTYTMDYMEAARLINIIKPNVAIPIHYGSIVGSYDDADKFKKYVNKDIMVDIRLKK